LTLIQIQTTITPMQHIIDSYDNGQFPQVKSQLKEGDFLMSDLYAAMLEVRTFTPEQTFLFMIRLENK